MIDVGAEHVLKLPPSGVRGRRLGTFANPGVSHVEMTSDELAGICPVTCQPDLYVAMIDTLSP